MLPRNHRLHMSSLGSEDSSLPDPLSDDAVESSAGEEQESTWYEDVAHQVVEADRKIKRLQELKTRMLASPCFDVEDVASVDACITAADQRIDAIQQAVSKAQWKVIALFITLKRREAFLEEAVSDKLLLPHVDGTLFQTLVQKQVYLTRIAQEKAQ